MTMRKYKSKAAARTANVQRFADGIRNLPLRLGEFTQNTFNASHYVPKFESLSRQQLEWAYQGSWICALAVDIIASDMTREGIDIKCENPDVIDELNAQMDDLRVWDSICDALRWSRLYGGAIAVMLINGQYMDEPLTEVRKDSFRGLLVLDRWQVEPSTEIIQDLGPEFGKPAYYQVIDNQGVTLPSRAAVMANRIHHSRVIRLDGRRLPYYLRQNYQGWGASVLESVMPQVKAFDVATQSAAQLLSKSYLRFYKVEGLRDILTNGPAREGFLKQMDYMRLYQNIEGLTIGDTSDDFQTMQYTFTGIPDILLQFGQQISGAIGVPLVRLFGQSPAGFNSTGESDIRIYYDNIKHSQDSDLRPGLKRLLKVMYESVTGQEPSKEFSFEFKSLWQMTNEQKSQAAQGLVGSIISALQADAITLPVAMKELRKLSDTVGLFSSISDEDIQAAEETENAMMPPEASMTEEPTYEGGSVQGAEQNGQDHGLVPEKAQGDSPAGAEDRC
jgi:phage-related protein (TIGR01555 family)